MEVKLFNKGMEKLGVDIEESSYMEMVEKLKINKNHLDFVLFEFLLRNYLKVGEHGYED